jgi:hypothetical protein
MPGIGDPAVVHRAGGGACYRVSGSAMAAGVTNLWGGIGSGSSVGTSERGLGAG